jgi:hypothetical protein
MTQQALRTTLVAEADLSNLDRTCEVDRVKPQ